MITNSMLVLANNSLTRLESSAFEKLARQIKTNKFVINQNNKIFNLDPKTRDDEYGSYSEIFNFENSKLVELKHCDCT